MWWSNPEWFAQPSLFSVSHLSKNISKKWGCPSPTDCLSISSYPSLMLPVSPSPSSKIVVCTSLGSSWVCLCSWKSGQTDLGSDSSSLYNDSDPSLFIKSCWPLRLHTPLPLLTDPHCIQAPSTALWNQTRKWLQRGIQKGVWVSVCVLNTMPKNIFWLNWQKYSYDK